MMARYDFIPGVSDHAHDRMIERLGRDLTRDEWLAVVLAIVERRAVLLCSADGSEHYLWTLGEVAMRLIWVPSHPAACAKCLPRSA